MLRTVVLGIALTGLSASAGAASSPLAEPDVIYENGKIYTGEPGSFVAAVAVKDGKVLATGTTEAMRALAGKQTRTHALNGQTVLPGFFDNHVHVGVGEQRVTSASGPDLEGLQDLADLRKRLQAYAASVPKGTWIVGEVPHATGGHEPFPETALPTRWQLDEAVPDHPVALDRGAHMMFTNSKALEIAGIGKQVKQPRGGAIDLDAKGEPIGILREVPAKRMVRRHMPPPPPITDEQATDVLKKRLRSQLAFGVTSLNIAGVRPKGDLRWLEKLYAESADQLPRSTVQLRVWPGYDEHDDPVEGARETIDEIEKLSFFTGFGNDHLRLGAIKMSVDGAFGGQAAWLIDSYPRRPGYHGTVRIPPETLYAVAKRAHDLGWQIGIHVIGDDAVKNAVDILDRVQSENPRKDTRHYLHHISVKPPEATLAKMQKAGIIAAMQPNFTVTIAPFYAQALSPEKLQTNNPQKSLRDAGIRMSLGSDGLPDGPLIGIYGAVTRKGVDGKVYGPQERISLEEALYNATVGSAYMTFNENNRGTLTPGMYADMVVLEEDIFTVDPERIRSMRVLETIVGGASVWRLAEATANREELPMQSIDREHAIAHVLGLGCNDHID